VHVYGNPCKVEEINNISKKYNLKVIYDAAHAFGVNYKGKSILENGDLSVLSFHATKIFSTIEGGAIICHSEEMKHRIDNLKNFGFRGETVVEEPGINAKLNEVQAAYGLLQLKYIDRLIEKRKQIALKYRELLNGTYGISFPEIFPDVEHNYSYFPILVSESEYGESRDDLYNRFICNNIYTRRYFYPLISNFSSYKRLKSSAKSNLKVANLVAEQVLCLPIYPDLDFLDVEKIVKIIKR
jgi:dTDP-4-amino-4,6-dideoxygalactose transaminase